ncbi:protein HASTY 1-like [Phragmites australis]|uniref:protein HASTY 1-like n=1 Tax=Phragmites australis TaxID=29695 RepID=UPI002D798535|nr:protein HASTY 1-like [Phragmites australis]
MEDDGDSTEESPRTQDIEDENSTMGKSSRMHATVESLAMKEDGGYVDTLMRVSLKLVCEEHPSEIRRHGLEILLVTICYIAIQYHLLRFRWKEISISECGNCVDILKLAEKLPEPSTKLASKRAAATLVAEIAWSHGVSLLRDLILRLVSLFEEGACEDELVCFILRSISNVGITRNAHIEAGDRGEMLVHGLGEFLPQILPLLCSLLDKHTRAAFSEQSNQDMEVANQHECTVKAALDAAHAYTEWAPVTDLAKYGLIKRCGSLLCSNIFRTHALQFFKSICLSKRPVGIAVAEYDVAVSNVFPILANISDDSLKFIEPELHCLKASCPSLGYHTVHAKTVDKLIELLESVPATCQDPSKSHSGRLLACSSQVHVSQVVDKISCPSIMKDDSGVSACIAGYSKEFNEYVGPRKPDINEEAGSLLVEEHKILSEAFTFVVSCPRIQNDTELLSCILLPLSKIWSQPEWETNLLHYFCDSQFRTSVHNVAVYFKEELKKCMSEKSNGIGQKGKSNYSSLITLLPLILPQLLKLLQYVHSLWTDEVVSIISEELEGAKFIMCSVDSSDLENDIRVWLQNIRKTGYKVIGKCSYLEGALHNLLDSTFVCGALMKDLESMEFRHLTWLIKYTIVPLVKNCPSELWTKWIDMLLQPVFHYFDYTLHRSWCYLLYHDMVQVPDNFGDTSVSKEEVEKLGKDLLFKLTREASDLLAAMALPELNGRTAHEYQRIIRTAATSVDLAFSSSLVRYLLYHDGLNHSILRLTTYIFGHWTDGVARIRAVPFCRSLIQFANVMHNDEVISVVKDDIIRNVIQCLALEKISDNNSEVLTDLCRDAYCCFQNQGLVGEEIFDKWLSMQKTVARYKNASIDEFEEIVWIWEIEEEFIGYLPTYTAMLHEVDVFGDSLKDGHLLRNSPSELMNELVSKHVVGNCTDSYLWTVSSMLSRKLSSVYWKRENEQMFKFLHKLIMFKPYIKDAPQYSGYEPYDESVQELLENDSEEWPMLAGYNRKSALGLFCRILELWEPQFHPLIREGHKDVLIEIASQLTFGEYIDFLQPFQPDSADFLLHLQPYVQNYIDDKNKNSGYDKAKEQAILHREFDVHLASGALDPYVRQISSSKGDFARNILEDDNLCDQFSDLDHDLLKMSLERRAKLLNEQDRLCLYFKCMEIVVANEQLRSGLESLMFELEAEGFFCVDDDSIEWGKKRFSELVDTFDKDVFDGFHLPKYYVVRGIMDLRQMLLKKDRTLEEAFEVVVGGAYHKWMGNLHLFWMDTRYYEHANYDIIKDPIKKVWKKMED